MKVRPAAIAVIMLLACATVSAAGSDPRLSAMGGIGVAVTGRNVKSYPNPASLFFDEQDFTFAFRLDTSDTFGVSSLPYLPASGFNSFFCADMISFSLAVLFDSANPRVTGNVDIYQTTSIDIDLTIGYGYISAGLGITGGSVRQRVDVPVDSYPEVANQCLLTKFDRVVNSEFIRVSAGIMLSYSQFSFGLLLDNILDKSGTRTTFNSQTLFGETCIGIYYSRPEYSKRGKMNYFVWSAGADICNLFQKEERSLNAGAELTFRFVRDFNVSLRSGYSARFNDFEEGTWTFGVASLVRNIQIDSDITLYSAEPPVVNVAVTVML